MFPSTPLLTDKEEEEERDDKKVEIVLMSSVIRNFLSVGVSEPEEEEGRVESFHVDCPFKNASDWMNRWR